MVVTALGDWIRMAGTRIVGILSWRDGIIWVHAKARLLTEKFVESRGINFVLGQKQSAQSALEKSVLDVL